MRRTKIVATLGPSSNSTTEITRLIHAGMDVARLNFSHGSSESHGAAIRKIRNISKAEGRTVGIMQDLPGPKIRIGRMAAGSQLARGSTVRLEPGEGPGDSGVIPVPQPEVLAALQEGDDVWLWDGTLHLRVTGSDGDVRTARVLAGGPLGSNKGMNLPGVDLQQSDALERDLEMFRFGIESGVSWVAVSFVGQGSDAEPFRKVAAECGSAVRLIAKIERRQALRNYDSILEAFDGVLVARGDLGIETRLTDVPVVQKSLVRRANEAGKPVIVATQMLLSMVNSPRPTRAEVTDVANAILDGADAVMLSEETAVGKYPHKAISTMAHVATSADALLMRKLAQTDSRRRAAGEANDSIATAAAMLARDTGASAVITCTATGSTARQVSKRRPSAPILAAVSDESSCCQLALSWGVVPYLVRTPASIDDMIHTAVGEAVKKGWLKAGQWVVILAGVRAGEPGNTSLIKYHRVGDRALQ